MRFLALLLVVATTAVALASDPDYNRDVCQMVTAKGYPCQQHSIQTDDGYILGAQRIPYGKAGPSSTTRPAVLLQHGLLDSSAAWVINMEYQSLAYIFADAGFDVWLGNSRGNTYSRAHIKYTTDDAAFWAFSFDDMATHDVPANIQYILKATGLAKIGYVGHSQGTIQMFAALSDMPEKIQDKIAAFAALAPVAYVGNSNSILINALAGLHVDTLFQLFGLKEFLPSSDFLHLIGSLFCPIVPELCEDFIFLLCGFNNNPMHNLNGTRFPVYISHTPAGTSVQNMAHWAQQIRTKRFEKYDFGTDGNIAHYGQATPPRYNLTNIPTTVPIGLFTGTNDALADPADVMILQGEVQPGVIRLVNNQPDYEHLDFTWGIDDHTRIYPTVVEFIRQYTSAEVAEEEQGGMVLP